MTVYIYASYMYDLVVDFVNPSNRDIYPYSLHTLTGMETRKWDFKLKSTNIAYWKNASEENLITVHMCTSYTVDVHA